MRDNLAVSGLEEILGKLGKAWRHTVDCVQAKSSKAAYDDGFGLSHCL